MATIAVSVTAFMRPTVVMELPPCALIADVKARVHEELGVPPSRQRLLRGMVVGSGWALSELAMCGNTCRLRLDIDSEAAVREEAVLHMAQPAACTSGFKVWHEPLIPLVPCVDEPRDARIESFIFAVCNGGRWRTGSSSTVFVAYSRGPVQVVRHGNIPGPSKQAIEGTAGPVERNGLCALWDSDADDVEAAAFVVACTDGTLKLCRREGGVAGARYVASSLLSSKSASMLPTALRAREAGSVTVHVLGKELMLVSSSGNHVDIWVRGESADAVAPTTAAGAGGELESVKTLPSVVRAARFRVHESSAVVSAMQFFADGRLACGCTNGAFTVWDLPAAVRDSDESLTLEPVARVALPAGIFELPLLADDVMGIFCIGTEKEAPGGCSLFEWRDSGRAGGRLRRRVGGLVAVSSVRLTSGVRRVVATIPAEDAFEVLVWDDAVANEATERREAESTGPATAPFMPGSNGTGVVQQSYVGCCTSTPWDLRRYQTCRRRCGYALVALSDGTVIVGEKDGVSRKLYFVNPMCSQVPPSDRGKVYGLQHLAPSAQLTSRGSQLLACALPHGGVLLADKRAVERACVVREATVAVIALATWSAQRYRRHGSAAQSDRDAAAAAGGALPAAAAEPSTSAPSAAASADTEDAEAPAAAARVDGSALLRTLGRLPRGAMAELYLQLRVRLV